MMIFNSLVKYASKWYLKASRSFTQEEIAAVDSAVVVSSQYGNSVCFMMVGGGQTYLPLSNDSTVGVGENVDLSKAQILTIAKDGEADIFRVKA